MPVHNDQWLFQASGGLGLFLGAGLFQIFQTLGLSQILLLAGLFQTLKLAGGGRGCRALFQRLSRGQDGLPGCAIFPLLLQPPATEWLLFFLAASAAKMSFSCCLSRAFPSSACSLAWHFFWALSSCSRCLTHLGITWVFPSQAIPLQVFPVGFSGGTGGARAKGPPLLILGAIRGFHL